MYKILEPQLKLMIINHLLERKIFTRGDTIINEFTIDGYTRRVDLALIKGNNFYAYEIKSSGDTLSRLNGQVTKYLEYFDKVTVVTSPKHTQKALDSTPKNVAIWEIDKDYIKVIRRGKKISTTDKYNFLRLMTAIELVKLARENKVIVPLHRRKVLEQNLIYLPMSIIRTYTLNFISKRYEKRNLHFFEYLQNASLSNTDELKLLRSKHNYEIKSSQVTSVSSLLKSLEILNSELEK